MTTCDLADRSCEPCRGGIPPLTPEEIEPFAAELSDGWSVVDHHHLHKRYDFDDFAGALAFVNAAGALAEQMGHHPDFELGWGRVVITLWTHKIDGLHEADFVLAARIDRIGG